MKVYEVNCLFPGGKEGTYDFISDAALEAGNMVMAQLRNGYCVGYATGKISEAKEDISYRPCRRLNKEMRSQVWELLKN